MYIFLALMVLLCLVLFVLAHLVGFLPWFIGLPFVGLFLLVFFWPHIRRGLGQIFAYGGLAAPQGGRWSRLWRSWQQTVAAKCQGPAGKHRPKRRGRRM